MSGGFQVFVALHMVDYASKNLMHFAALSEKAGKNVAGINKQLQLMGGLAGMLVGGATIGFLLHLGKESTEAAMGVERLNLQLKNMGVTASGLKSVTALVDSISAKHPMLDKETGLHIFKDSYTVLGDMKEALRVQEAMSKYTIAMQGIYGVDKAEGMGLAGQRFAELSMGKNFNDKRMMELLDVVTKVATASGGQISPQQMFSMAKQMPIGRMHLSNDALMHLMTLDLEMGGSRAGTAVTAIQKKLLAKVGTGGQSKSSLELFNDIGLLEHIGRNPRSGKIDKFNVKNESLLATDPIGWLQQMYAPAFKKHYGFDSGDLKAVPIVGEAFRTNPAISAALSTVTQTSAIDKHNRMFKGAKGIDDSSRNTENSPVGKFAAYQASMHNLQIALGQGLIPLFTKLAVSLTPVIQGMTQFINAHPRLTRLLFVLGLVAGGALFAAGAIAVLAALFTVTIPAGVGWAVVAVGAGIAAIAGMIASGGIVAAWRNVCSAVVGAIYGILGAVQGMYAKIPGIGAMMPMLKTGMPLSASQQAMKNHWTTPGKWTSSTGHSLSDASGTGPISIHIHESKTPRETAMAVKDVMKDLVNPKSGFTNVTTPNMMHGYA